MKLLNILEKPVKPNRKVYPRYLAVTTDTLLILDEDSNVIERVIQGFDTQGVILNSETEDNFLDALFTLCRIHDEKYNMLKIALQLPK